MTIKHIFPLLLLFLTSACYRVSDKIDPRINYQIQDQHFSRLSSAFPPLSHAERASDWGREYIIAQSFAKELDLYRAVSTFKRAAILVPDHKNFQRNLRPDFSDSQSAEDEGDLIQVTKSEREVNQEKMGQIPKNFCGRGLVPIDDENRRLEIQYDILLCYFLGKRYDEAVEEFEKSDLACVDKTFPAYHDLLLVLYECYKEMDETDKQMKIADLLEKTYPDTAEKLKLSRAIREGDLDLVACFAEGFQYSSYLDDLLSYYNAHKKSVAGAQLLNAVLPGAGYFYIGQRKSAVTALLLNGLFITAAVQFFRHNHFAAGIITAGFESGWYFGGIYGAGEEAKYYNERLYEKKASILLNQHHLFPTLMMKYEF